MKAKQFVKTVDADGSALTLKLNPSNGNAWIASVYGLIQLDKRAAKKLAQALKDYAGDE